MTRTLTIDRQREAEYQVVWHGALHREIPPPVPSGPLPRQVDVWRELKRREGVSLQDTADRVYEALAHGPAGYAVIKIRTGLRHRQVTGAVDRLKAAGKIVAFSAGPDWRRCGERVKFRRVE